MPQLRIRTLMIAVPIAGLGSWIAARNGRIDYRHAILAAAGSAGVAAVLALLTAWVWVAYTTLRPPKD